MTTPEELRALVAEKVMGYERHCALNVLYWITKDGNLPRAFWNPLDSWADAGRVIERMSDLGFQMILNYGPYGDDVIFDHAEDDRWGYSKGKSIKRHISRAALRALGVEVE